MNIFHGTQSTLVPYHSAHSVGHDQVLTVKATYMNRDYSMSVILETDKYIGLDSIADVIRHHERELHKQIKLKSLNDHYEQLGWTMVSYAHTTHSVMEMHHWVLHCVNGMNMNMLDQLCWWFEHADDAAFFRLRWG